MPQEGGTFGRIEAKIVVRRPGANVVEFGGDRVSVDRGYNNVYIIAVLTLLINRGKRMEVRSTDDKNSRSYSRTLDNASTDWC